MHNQTKLYPGYQEASIELGFGYYIIRAMAKRRTKKQKKRSQKRRSAYNVRVVNKKERVVEFGYERALIKKDLRKTVIISLLILGVELGLYFWIFN